MADKTTIVAGLTLRGIVEPAEARQRYREHCLRDLERVQTALACTDLPVTYWQGNAQLHPACEEAAVEPRPGHGPGVPGAMHLEAFGQAIADAFGHCPYHVGSSATSKTWRDVDVRLILDDDRFAALFPGFANARHIDAWWSLLCAALSELGRARTGLPIDFQIQSMTEANEKYSGIRNPLFLIRSRDEHEPRMVSNADLAARDEPGGERP